MKYLSCLVLLFYLSLTSCQYEPECDMYNEYRVRVISDSYDDYALYVDGEYIQDIYSLEYIDLAMVSGEHEIFLEQINGFHNQPNTEVYLVNGYDCDYVEVLFPD